MRYTSKYNGCQKCPFFVKEYISTITCEGIGQSVGNVMRFNNENEKDNFMEGHCMKEFPRNCPLFTILWEQNS